MVSPQEAGGYAQGGPVTGTPAGILTDPAALARELGGGDPPAVLDVRWRLGGPPGLDRYRAGHLPGAVFVDLDRDLAGSPGPGGRHPLPAVASFQAAMRRAGVSDGQPAVVYDEDDSMAAARAWWLLCYFGHRRVQVLDGGYQAWVAAGLPVAPGDDGPAEPGTFTAQPGQLPVLDAPAAGRLARQGVLLDARAAERYRGDQEPVDPVAGHIPGAISAPATANVTADGRFARPAELRARFAVLGLPVAPGPTPAAPGAVPGGPPGELPGEPPGEPPRIGVYCGSGVTAAHEVLALRLAGLPAALYPGSWSEWITDPGRPVTTGPAPG
jgi:thiosulfate/3-mercaptopyruvate sulfurtransferase